jgi:AAA ATPase domain
MSRSAIYREVTASYRYYESYQKTITWDNFAMNPTINPFSPGAGTMPPELVGREPILEKARIVFERALNGLDARGMLLVGLRGVGKTVLLHEIERIAQELGGHVASIESPENRSLPAQLAPVLRALLIRISRKDAAKSWADKAMKALGGFVSGMQIKFNDIEFGIKLDKEEGVADSGDLEADLSDLMIAIGEAARSAKSFVLLSIDELQYVEEQQLGALIMAMHQCSKRRLPVILIAAGLPQLVGNMGKAKSYAERLFEYPSVGALDQAEAFRAIREPAQRHHVETTDEALKHIFQATQGYPYFLQEWGKHSWNIAAHSPINLMDAEAATQLAVADLDASFFRVRFDRLTPIEKRYIQAMAELGPGPYRSGEIAARMKRDVNQVAPTRASLIKKGMIYSPAHGDTAFTVPQFDAFIRRTTM